MTLLFLCDWLLSVEDKVRNDMNSQLDGAHCDAAEHVITKHQAHDTDGNIADTIDAFWNEFEQSQNQTWANFKNPRHRICGKGVGSCETFEEQQGSTSAQAHN